MSHLNRFETETQYDNFKGSDNYLYPDVSYIVQDEDSRYNDYASMPFTIQIIGENDYAEGDTYNLRVHGQSSKVIKVRINFGEWFDYNLNEGGATEGAISGLTPGDLVQFESYTTQVYDFEGMRIFDCDTFFNVFGNLNSINAYSDVLAEYNYSYLFNDTSRLISAKNLILPSTTLAAKCYQRMFYYCTNLISAPALPATTLANHCYERMFYGCTSLMKAPELPAMTLEENCYEGMFNSCTSLTATPVLPATTLASSCYFDMFYGCESLKQAPELPATTLVHNCYHHMFNGCTSLTKAPKLPATTLAQGCYSYMFQGCTNLTTAPELPATTLADYCYDDMFQGCTSLTVAPALPATTLTDYCYAHMFHGCTSLSAAPELITSSLTEGCYQRMFYGCSNLKYIKCIATDITATDCTTDWTSGVSSGGLFVKENTMMNWNRGPSGIPQGWRISGKYVFNLGNYYVEFAPGNLQALSVKQTSDPYVFNVDEGYWKFADKQYQSFKSGGTLEAGHNIDLFCWVGKSATYDTYGVCSNTNYDNEYYGTEDLEPLKSDWGQITRNNYFNDGTGNSSWRTPNIDEWTYLLFHYTVAEIWIHSQVNGLSGLMIFPDIVDPTKYIENFKAFEKSTGNQLNNPDGYFNEISMETFNTLDDLGVLFLPATAYRDGANIVTESYGFSGYYWSSTPKSVKHAYRLAFDDYAAGTTKYQSRRHYGRAVRLVKDLFI